MRISLFHLHSTQSSVLFHMKETPKEAGLKYLGFDRKSGLHTFQDIHDGSLSRWAANKNHASYGLKFKNTHLEFVDGNQG